MRTTAFLYLTTLCSLILMVGCIGSQSERRSSDIINSSTPILTTQLAIRREQPTDAALPMPPSRDQAVEPVSYVLDESLDEDIVFLDATSDVGPVEPNETIALNLPTALSMVGPKHPTVGLAQWRVQEAYAQLDQAKVLWLPTIQSGFSFHRHDGNYQASNASIVDVNRNSFQYGLGTGATGAGTTPRPGVLASFHLADAIFQPLVAERVAWARSHAMTGQRNDQLLAVALAYFDLVDAVQGFEIASESLERTEALSKTTSDFAESGEGLQADADRMATELTLARDRLFIATETVDSASARLAREVGLRNGCPIRPLDMIATPIEMIPCTMDLQALIATGLQSRPELKEAQSLVAAACEQYRREKKAPFVPSVLLGFSTGGFGGGLRDSLDNVDSRYDFDAVATWQVRNLGHGERAARRVASARVQQARYEKIRLLDQVAQEISEAHAQVANRTSRVETTRQAIETAESSYTRNLERIRDGQGLPVEVLQAVRALEDAQRAHLRAITGFNRSQFRLHWAVGCKLLR